jgi:hypothetical protein
MKRYSVDLYSQTPPSWTTSSGLTRSMSRDDSSPSFSFSSSSSGSGTGGGGSSAGSRDPAQTPMMKTVTGKVPISIAAHIPPIDPDDPRGIAFTYNFDLEADLTSDTLGNLQLTVETYVNRELLKEKNLFPMFEWRIFAAKSTDGNGRELVVSSQSFVKRGRQVFLRDAFQLLTGTRKIVCYGLTYLRGTDEYGDQLKSQDTQIKRIKQ